MNNFLEKIFSLQENNTNVRTEVLAGITSFMTMAYILAVNPNILGCAGMDQGSVFTATAISACVGSLLMAFFSNCPFVLAPGMGINAFFAFTLVAQMGYPWQMGLAGSFHTTGIGAVLAIIGIILTAIFLARNVTGGILWGILCTWGLGIACELTGFYVPNPAQGMFSVLPDFSKGISIPSIAPTFMQLDFSSICSLGFVTILVSIMFVDLFNTIGTLIGVAAKANMLDSSGKLPKIEKAFMADSIATSVGALLGWNDFTEAIPAFIAAIMMPFTYSISEGIAMGVISYVIINLFAGSKIKNISGVTYLLALIFILKYIFV